MKVAFTTLGCKVNSYETEAVWELLQKEGYERVEFNQFSDIYIINTCMVTNTGEAKSRKMIRHPQSINSNAITIVMGCLTQLKAKEILEIPGVKIVLGTKNRDLIGEYLKEYLEILYPLNKVDPLLKNEKYDELQIDDFVHHQRAFLKIQDGCNNYCSYCIIPFARGRVRSKPASIILKEAQSLVQKGHKELILTGIHTGGYGEDLKGYSFLDLLKELEQVQNLKRIRISSIEISELTPELIDFISTSKKIVNHLHIPLQSGSDKILKLMNRKYTLQEFYQKVELIRKKIKNVAITTDVIVGFPSETGVDFQDTISFIKKVNFQELHVFGFSKRTGTLAALLKEEVPSLIKKNRVNQLIDLSCDLAKEFIKENLNLPINVIVEQEKDGYFVGHTSNYIFVKFKGQHISIGDEVTLQIIKEDYPLSFAQII
ncbi:MAG: tRNA (N(6)-L-threonylcarbamoyladenosine(37)-C(2))-methylthiotransferase MtaB [Firmicutes bacterium]|nr:tRNA (N(6)-L-threonylcarbamoyladenosine(37)-C(2))-methylthiotransferase MtaB [Bacillota bacterium]